jgi:hypothetical protein
MFTVLLATIAGATFAQGTSPRLRSASRSEGRAERRGDEGKDRADSAQANGKSRRGGKTATESQKNTAKDKKDDLEGALDDLNGSTNRLRRKFDPGDHGWRPRAKWKRVMDDARELTR